MISLHATSSRMNSRVDERMKLLDYPEPHMLESVWIAEKKGNKNKTVSFVAPPRG